MFFVLSRSSWDFGMPLMSIINSMGSSTEPYGTPDSMRLAEVPEPFKAVWNPLCQSYVLMVFRILAGKPQSFIFSSRPSWRILYCTLSLDPKTPMMAVCFRLKAVVTWSVIRKGREVVECHREHRLGLV
ncbi:hypothetical protein Trydic_g21145 [Trypoxylus dichotomus]